MQADRDKWNAKYRQAEPRKAPHETVARYWSLAPAGGRALDLAAGLGGNALFLADCGFSVDAVDISDVAMDRLARCGHPGVTPLCADLDHYDIPAGRYGLIVNLHFLNRRLFPLIREGLAPGGLLIFETFLEGDPLAAREPPPCRDYLLRPNELLHAFLSLHILFYAERANVPPLRASHVATLVARRR